MNLCKSCLYLILCLGHMYFWNLFSSYKTLKQANSHVLIYIMPLLVVFIEIQE